MPKIAAIEFEGNLARVLIARTSGSGFKLSSAFEVDTESNWEDEGSDFGKNLAKALGSRVGRCDALVSFGRGQSELRVINVPVVPDNELPDIVRFQAQRQFTHFAENFPVDFLPLTESGDEKKVLAATVSRSALQKIVSGCQTAGLNVTEVKLRATCTTALYQSIHPESKNYIIVEPTEKSFNLEVVAYGKLCLTRTVRSASEDTTGQIIRDIRRTLAAANNQIPGYETSKVVVFGKEADFPGLRATVEKELQFDVDFVDPFDHAEGITERPENTGHYASLVGLLVSHCSPTTETIDFLNPRKKVSGRGNNRVAILAGIAAAILFIGLFGLGYLMLSQKSSQIAKLRQEISAQRDSDQIAQQLIGDIEKIEAFDNNQAIWLKELAVLSERSMDPDQLIANSATFTLDLARKDGGVKIEADGYLQSGAVSEQLANRIRELKAYSATLENVVLLSENEKDQDIYSHKFKARIRRDPQVVIPEVGTEAINAYMQPRIEAAQKALETAAKNPASPPPDPPTDPEPGEDEPAPEDQGEDPEETQGSDAAAETEDDQEVSNE